MSYLTLNTTIHLVTWEVLISGWNIYRNSLQTYGAVDIYDDTNPTKYSAYTYLKGHIYCVSRDIPAGLRNYYRKARAIQSLLTTNCSYAVHSSGLLSVRLKDY